MMTSADSPFMPGELYNRRKDLHAKYKGQERAGIITPARFPMIFLITGEAGRQHGYEDHWSADGNTFLYYGEGQVGNMQYTKGNKALRDHVENRKSVHVFEAVPKKNGWLKYVGEMECIGSEWTQAPDTHERMRRAILFQLRPVLLKDSDEAVFAAVEQARKAVGGQGFAVDPRKRKLVEDYAVDRAKSHFESLSYQIKVVGKPYDLRCTKDQDVLYVEVKGTQTTGDEILLTPGEVEFAEQHRGEVALFLVHDVVVTGEESNIRASGGDVRLENPWRIMKERLTVVGYSYKLPTDHPKPASQAAKAAD